MRSDGECPATGAPTSGANQRWIIGDIGAAQTGPVTLTARHSGKCADVVSQSTADGAEIAQYGCHGGANQQWRRTPA